MQPPMAAKVRSADRSQGPALRAAKQSPTLELVSRGRGPRALVLTWCYSIQTRTWASRAFTSSSSPRSRFRSSERMASVSKDLP